MSKLEKHITENREAKNKYELRIHWKSPTPDEIRKLKEQSGISRKLASKTKQHSK